MQEIVSVSKELNEEKKAIDAKINNKYITPGINGKLVDINKSYEKMKKLGEYNKNLLVFISDYPNISINNTYDKYINNGNKTKTSISLIFNITDTTNIKDILSILDKNNIKATFTTNLDFAYNNNTIIKDINNYNHLIIIKSNNEYSTSYIKKTNLYLKNIIDYNIKYCYLEKEIDELLESCKNNNMHTIIPTLIDKTYPAKDMKNNLNNGGIYSLDTNDYTIKELGVIINYIKQKGKEIVRLDNLLNEEIN